VCINFLNGKKIFDRLVRYKGQYKITWKDDLQWGAFKFDEPLKQDSKFLIYMNGAYGVTNGSIERLVTPQELINAFSENFDVLQNMSFSEFMKESAKWKNLIKFNFQKEIISLHHNLLFVKK